MIKPELLAILCCPETRQPLALASAETLARLNAAIACGSLVNRAGEKIADPLQAGLTRGDGRFLYPIRNDLPILLIDQGLPL